jgi:hypothetical protein
MGPEWFVHMLQGSRDSLSVALTLRTLFVLLQERDDYAQVSRPSTCWELHGNSLE